MAPVQVIADERQYEEDSSAAAASNLVDFFQTAAQRWQAPIASGSAAVNDIAVGEASGAVSGISGALNSKEAVQSEMPPAAGHVSQPPSAPGKVSQPSVSGNMTQPLVKELRRPAAEPVQSTAAANPYRMPVLAVIQSWQPSSGSTAVTASGTASHNLDTAPQPAQLAKTGAQAVPKDLTGQPLSNAALRVPAQQVTAGLIKGAPSLITPAKEVVMPNAASPPFSADTV